MAWHAVTAMSSVHVSLAKYSAYDDRMMARVKSIGFRSRIPLEIVNCTCGWPARHPVSRLQECTRYPKILGPATLCHLTTSMKSNHDSPRLGFHAQPLLATRAAGQCEHLCLLQNWQLLGGIQSRFGRPVCPVKHICVFWIQNLSTSTSKHTSSCWPLNTCAE